MVVSLSQIARQLLRRVPPFRRAQGPPPPLPSGAVIDPAFAGRKRAKLDRIRPLLRDDLPHGETETFYDFLSDDLRTQFHITDTDNVSANNYDDHAARMIEIHSGGFVLDCGAGLRPVYYDNVVNFDICPYPTTDVRGVGERLPFKDGVFQAVFSFAVLEHVRDPFACAKEIMRVLVPGGRLYCVVPFLQPLHGYPHHYFNMSHEGLRSLFEDGMEIKRQEVPPSGQPIWTLTWLLRRWAAQLPESARRELLSHKVGDLLADPREYLDRSFVRDLPLEAQMELASTTALFAEKPE
ncbi:methyltransferase domain-containing protein [Limnoglobus roseus]|uniref:Class I SAM-dependent methyltransferase n=1 Tax=Limnoglobus roseus TaxID=2598579 RepID=A0A5C1AFN1_9BACT|nr:class I SAM-dependent methyltransferase [Limnoglobus roseus]QEL15954.1 class I SAM-dependent methyltransferase [Limnoglobus roseus]